MDPIQCVNQLRQSLAAGKLPVGFILGAGCPCAVRVSINGSPGPLIPDVKGLTNVVKNGLASSTPFSKLISTLTEDNLDDPDVEIMLSRVRALKEVAGNGAPRGLNSHDLVDLEREITKAIVDTVNKRLPGQTTPYHALARFVRSERRPHSEVFTMNYDVLMEQALEDEMVPYTDGFVGSSRPFFDQRIVEEDNLPERWSRLWKLHGSINWRLDKTMKRVVRSYKEEDGDEVLIHPSHLKYDESRRMPFLVMIDRLKNFIRNQRNPVSLFALGYSFRDNHINAVLVDSLRDNPNAACLAIQHGDLVGYPNARALAEANPSLWILGRDGAIIRGTEIKWTATAAMDKASLAGTFEVPDFNVGESEDATRACQLKLGDFKVFGEFLDHFVTNEGATKG